MTTYFDSGSRDDIVRHPGADAAFDDEIIATRLSSGHLIEYVHLMSGSEDPRIGGSE